MCAYSKGEGWHTLGVKVAFESYRNRFKGSLANIEVANIRTLDKDKLGLKDRKAFLEEKYKNITPFLEEYNSNYYKCNLNSDDSLSSDINIFKYLENDATYLLNSIDIEKQVSSRFCNRQDNTNLVEFNSIEDNQDNYRLAPKEDIFCSDFLVSEIFSGDYEHYLDNWIKNNVCKIYIDKEKRTNEKNRYKPIRFVSGAISNNKLSFEQFERYKKLQLQKIEILNQLDNTRKELVYLKETLLVPSENVEEEVKRRKSLRIVINSIRELKKDMIYTKKAFTPRIEISPDKCCSELNLCDNMDYSNVVHVKNALLIYPSERISNEFNIIAYDIQKAINDLKLEGKLSAYELKLIDLYRKTVSNIKICSKELNKHRTQIYRDLDRIVEKICKKLNKK